MRRLLAGLWRAITFPFRLIFNILAFHFRQLARLARFLNGEPEEHPLADVLTGLVTDPAVRDFVWAELDDFRKHLLRCVLVVLVAVGITFSYTLPVMEFLALPIGGLQNLQAIQVTEEVGVFMKIALSLGITITFPYLVFELWWFAAPGLRPRERKFGLASIPLATLLFLAGMAFTYFLLIPAALPFLGGFTPIQQNWTAMEYFDFVNGLIFWLGVSFEFPLLIYVITAMGLVRPRVLVDQWRLAMVIIAVLAAAITPTVDIIPMALVMLPLAALYFVSIGLSYVAYAGRKRSHSSAEPQEGR
jgi:sec-independent protein translocase protein TatC